MPDNTVPSIPGLGDIHDGERALREVLPELQALPADKIRKPNVDVTDAATIASGAYDSITFFRDEIRTKLPTFELRNLDKLKVYALAAWHATSTAQLSAAAGTPFDALVHEASDLSDDLAVAGNALARKGFVPAASFVRSGTSHRAVADDLNKRVNALRAAWSAIQGKTTVTSVDLEKGAELAARIILEIQNAANPPTNSTTDMRYRAFTVFDDAYEECRRAVQYLRYYQDDAENFAPTLRQMAKGRRDPGEKSTTKPAVPSEPAKPLVAAPASDGKPIGDDSGPFVNDAKKG